MEELSSSLSSSTAADNLVCIADAWFMSIVVSMSVVCLMLSAMIVIWGCDSLHGTRKLPV
jgi:hypothetical protein